MHRNALRLVALCPAFLGATAWADARPFPCQPISVRSECGSTVRPGSLRRRRHRGAGSCLGWLYPARLPLGSGRGPVSWESQRVPSCQLEEKGTEPGGFVQSALSLPLRTPLQQIQTLSWHPNSLKNKNKRISSTNAHNK